MGGRTIAVLAGLAAAAVVAMAQTPLPLTGGKIARFKDRADFKRDKGVVKFVKDLNIALPFPDPTCPATSTVTIRTDAQTFGPIALDCANWSARRTGYVYKSKLGVPGGVTKIVLKAAIGGGKLLIKLKGDQYGPNVIRGPVNWVEAELTIDNTTYCGRFDPSVSEFRRNEVADIIVRGPSMACFTPTPTVTPTPTTTPTFTPTMTPTATPTPTITPTFTRTFTPTITPTYTPTWTPGGPSATPTFTPTITPTITPTFTPTPTPTNTPTPTPTPTPQTLLFFVGNGSTAACPLTRGSTPQDPTLSTGSIVFTHGNPEGLVFPSPWCNFSIGDSWDQSAAIQLQLGTPDVNGQAPLTMLNTVVVAALTDSDVCEPLSSTPCWLCIRLRQDPANMGFVDCDGGTNVDIHEIVNSNTTSAPPPPDPLPTIAPDSSRGPGNLGEEPGHAIGYVLAKFGFFQSSCPAENDPVWNTITEDPVIVTTGIARARIDNPRVCDGTFGVNCPTDNPYEVALYGAPFQGIGTDCSGWAGATGAALVNPQASLDQDYSSAGTGDLAQILRVVQN